jgi:hypothetical protein
MNRETLELLVWVLAAFVVILLAFLLFRKYIRKFGPSVRVEAENNDWSAERLTAYHQDLTNRLALSHVPSHSPDAVPLQTLERIADIHAAEIWGKEISRGKPIQIVDGEGEPVTYAFPFLIGGEAFPEGMSLLMRLSQMRGLYKQTGNIPKNPSLSEEVKAELKRYGTVYVSARRGSFPVPRVTHGLHPYFYRAEEALLKSGLARCRLSCVRFIPPCYDFLEINDGENTQRLQVDLLIKEEEIRAAWDRYKPALKTAIPAPGRTADIAARAEAAWKAYLDVPEGGRPATINQPGASPLPLPPIPGGVEYRIRYWERIPPILWTRWCEPTSASMVFSYWDHYVPIPGIGTHVGYDRIVDYWWDHPSNGNNVPDILDPIADGPNIDVANVLKGYNWTVTKHHGDHSNHYALDHLRSEILANRPVVWHLFTASFGHATCGFGFRMMIFVPETYVILYNTWDESVHEWLYDSYSGAPLDRVEVDAYVPAGKELYRYLFIRHPYGAETFHVGVWNEIRFAVHPQTDIAKARIEYSLDGGRTWTLLREVPVHPDWNSLWWRPTVPTQTARIRVRGLAADNSYLGGDGSYRNFSIV